MKFPDNLKYLRKLRKLSQIDLANELALTNSAISNWEQGIAVPDTLTSLKLSNYFGISVNDLFVGNVESIKGNKSTPKIVTVKQVDKLNDLGVPYYEMLPVSAGDFPSILQEAKPSSYIDLPQLTGCVAVLQVHGYSMKGVVEPGDLIAIKEISGRHEFDPSLPYLIITDEHRMIKYLRVDNDDSSIIWAESTNHQGIKLQADNIRHIYAIKCIVRFM